MIKGEEGVTAEDYQNDLVYLKKKVYLIFVCFIAFEPIFFYYT